MSNEKEKQFSVKLSYDELLLIDGKCNEEAQKVIDNAKIEHGFGLDPICNEILAQSMKTGKLTWTTVTISSCNTCSDKPQGYQRYPRSSRYHRKGDINYDKPFKYYGVKPNEGFLIISGVSGICYDCWKNVYLPKLVNYIINNDLPIQVQKNDIAETKYKKDNIHICKECGYKMKESEMGRERCWFGDGTYPAKCPKCNSENNEITKDFVMTKISQTTKKEE